MAEPSAPPPIEPPGRRALRRLRDWGGPEMLRVGGLFLFGLCFGSGYAMTEPGYRLGEKVLNRIRSIPAAELPPPAPAEDEPPVPETPGGRKTPDPAPNPYFGIWRAIFLHNLKVALIAAAGGLLSIGIPYGVSLLNGTFLGLCSVVIMIGDGLSWSELLLFLGPHGIFELPAILLACVIGSRLRRAGRSDPAPWARWRALRGSWRELAAAAGLLLLAAAIEARTF